MTPEVTAWAAFIAIAVLGGLFRGFAGFGSGLIMSPVLLVFFEPTIAIPTLVLVEIIASIRLVVEAYKEIEWRRVAWFGVPAAMTIQMGALALISLDANLVRQIVAGVVLCAVFLMASGWRYPGRLGGAVSVIAGCVGGFLSALAGVGGPPVVLTMLADEAPESTVRANLIGYFMVIGLVSIAAYVSRGLIDEYTLRLGAAGALPHLIAIQFGAWGFRRFGGRWMRPASLLLLGIVAVATLVI